MKQITGALLAALLIALVAPWKESEDPAPGGEAASTPTGFYPPAPSKAVGMTPEWREFADSVDRICATSYNEALGIEAQVERVAAVRGWSDGRAEAVRLQVWNDQALAILRETEALGTPPARPDLLRRWRANVAKRLALRTQAAQAASEGRWGAYRGSMNGIYPLKDQSDEIGQRFGLRICTSN